MSCNEIMDRLKKASAAEQLNNPLQGSRTSQSRLSLSAEELIYLHDKTLPTLFEIFEKGGKVLSQVGSEPEFIQGPQGVSLERIQQIVAKTPPRNPNIQARNNLWMAEIQLQATIESTVTTIGTFGNE